MSDNDNDNVIQLPVRRSSRSAAIGEPPNEQLTTDVNPMSMEDAIRLTLSRKPNAYVGPSAEYIIGGLIEDFLNRTYGFHDGTTNRDYPFNVDDSYSWTIVELKALLRQIVRSND
jgi:hypothetical protein